MWWLTPVIPATLEAEAGELLEPRRWRLKTARAVSVPDAIFSMTISSVTFLPSFATQCNELSKAAPCGFDILALTRVSVAIPQGSRTRNTT